MDLFFTIIAGITQGLTEFLPISSTGHLIIIEKLFGVPSDTFGLAFDASLHLGTFLAVLIFFHKDYLKVFSLKNKLYIKLTVGTLPGVIFGLVLENYIETSFRSLTLIALSLIIFSFLIYFADKRGAKNKTDEKISILDSLIIGLSQALALVPGVSRSGATISAGLLLGQTRESAAKFAFMLSGPIIAGAGTKKFLEVVLNSGFQKERLDLFFVGIVTSFVFGYLTIKYFLKYMTKQTLMPFIVYRIILGIILLVVELRLL